MDEGHKLTDKKLEKLIRKLDKVYSQAAKETEVKLNDYMRRFKVKDAIKQRQVKAGEISHEEWINWRVGQIAVGQRWEEMRNTLAEDLTNVDKIAAQMVGESMHEVYALNHNFGTFEAEKGSLVDTSYTLYDRHTVERLVRDNPTLLKAPSLDINKDYRWNAQNFQSAITQSILQGEDIRKTAKRVALGTTKKDRNAAVRNARTAITNAENAGRCDSYERAEKMGIKFKQVWLAALDGRTRDSHRRLDGEKIPVGGKFSNGLRFPGDPQGAAHEVWNCRCTLIAEVDGVDYGLTDVTQRNNKLGDMSYKEWENEHGKTVPTKGMGDEYTGLDGNGKSAIPKFNNYMLKNHPEAFGDVDALKSHIQKNYRKKFSSQMHMVENDPDAIALGYRYCSVDEYLNADFRKQLYLIPEFEDYYKYALAEYGHEYADSGTIMNALFRYNIGANPDGYGKGKGARLIFDKETGLSDFIDKNPDVHYNGGTLYRGLMTNGKGIKDLEKAMKNGKPISMRGVSSWSTNQNIADDFSKYRLRKSTNPVIFEDTSEGTRNAMPFPYSSKGFTPQNEVIYSGSAEFDILEIRKENGVTHVKVKQRKK